MKKDQNSKQHFDHQHILIPLHPEEGEEIMNCKACEQPITNQFHGCLKCKFYMHDGCANAPRSLEHPAHPAHPLTLLPTPTHSIRAYFCDACGSKSSAYSFSCAHCNFDLHMQCACMSNTIVLEQHLHELKLIFGSPYEDKGTKYMCDVCSGDMNPEFWVYYCGECDFAAHLGCAMGSKGGKHEAKLFSDDGPEDQQMTIAEAEEISRMKRRAREFILDSIDGPSRYRYY